MCYSVTPYHSCGCYGKPVLMDGGCVRATTQVGLKAGCWDTQDLGVENVDTVCIQCFREEQRRGPVTLDSSPQPEASVFRVSSSATLSNFLQIPATPIPSRSGSNSSTATESSASPFTSTAISDSSRTSALAVSIPLTSIAVCKTATAEDARTTLSFLPVTAPNVAAKTTGITLHAAVVVQTSTGTNPAANMHWRTLKG